MLCVKAKVREGRGRGGVAVGGEEGGASLHVVPSCAAASAAWAPMVQKDASLRPILSKGKRPHACLLSAVVIISATTCKVSGFSIF